MAKPPFNTNGIYVCKLDPTKDLINHKPTMLGSLFNTAVGKKEEAYYRVICFTEKSEFRSITRNQNSEPDLSNAYCADFSTVVGELLNISDKQKKRGSIYYEYKNVTFYEKQFEFGKESLTFSGNFYDLNLIYLTITNSETGKSISGVYRFIPWV